MSDTVNSININDEWTEVADLAGFASPTKSCQYCVYAGTPPENLRGHRLNVKGFDFAPEDGEKLWVKADTDSNVSVVFTAGQSANVKITSPLETSDRGNSALPVFVQDQTTGVLDLPFLQELNTTALVADTAVNSHTVSLAPGHGAVVGNTLEIADTTNGSWFQQSLVLAVAGDNITLDSPICRIFTVSNTTVVVSSKDMAVSGTPGAPVVFSVNPLNVQEGDITRLICTITDNVDMDFETFGGLPALTNGIVLRVNNGDGTYRILQNFKTNGDIALYSFDTSYFANNGGGTRGFQSRMTFAGQSKHGVVVRLDGSINESLELLVQDTLIGLNSMQWLSQGSEVQG